MSDQFSAEDIAVNWQQGTLLRNEIEDYFENQVPAFGQLSTIAQSRCVTLAHSLFKHCNYNVPLSGSLKSFVEGDLRMFLAKADAQTLEAARQLEIFYHNVASRFL